MLRKIKKKKKPTYFQKLGFRWGPIYGMNIYVALDYQDSLRRPLYKY
jgi:hypothetical protein